MQIVVAADCEIGFGRTATALACTVGETIESMIGANAGSTNVAVALMQTELRVELI